jgi:hypothetical protein
MQDTLQDVIRRIQSGSQLTIEETLWIGLCGGLVFATLHLLTMLATRWGDRNATAKSLIFSILVHLSCSLGVVAFHPTPQVALPRDATLERMEVRQIVVDGEEHVPSEQQGNTPIDQRLTDPIEQQIARSEHMPLDLQPLELPERREFEETPLPTPDLPDLMDDPQPPPPVPKPDNLGDVGALTESARLLKVDDPTAEAQPDVSLPAMSAQRLRPTDPGQELETAVSRTSKPGAVDRIAPELDDRHMASIDAPSDTRSFLKRDDDERFLQRRSGPAPATVIPDEAGNDSPAPSETVSQGLPAASNFTRKMTRVLDAVDDGRVERIRPNRTPLAPSPESRGSAVVRDTGPIEIADLGPQPNLVRPNFDTIRKPEDVRVPSTYRLRNLERRREFARRFGGTEQSERAVEASLEWLARHQHPDGFWDADRFGAGQVAVDEAGVNRRNAGIHADSGVTALADARLSWERATRTKRGNTRQNVDRAIPVADFSKQTERTDISAETRPTTKSTYCHGMATYALAEAYGMQSDPTTGASNLRPMRSFKRSRVTFSRQCKIPTTAAGGMSKDQKGDMSIFGWQLMALKSAEIAGIPDSRRDALEVDGAVSERRAVIGVRSGGLAGYREDRAATHAGSMTAEALFCKQMLGLHPHAIPPACEAVGYLLQNIPASGAAN